MTASSYDASLRALLAHEGGYSNHPDDPGGPTNFGITIFDYRKYVKPDAGAADVKVMTLEEARSIYRAKYWDALRADDLPAGVDYAVFDYGVNSGIARAAKVLQRLVGVTGDGVIGPRTLAAAGAHEPNAIVTALCDERLKFLQSLHTWPVFGKGWGRRVAEVKTAALEMAVASAKLSFVHFRESGNLEPKNWVPASAGSSGKDKRSA
jgi:lysozyme family protein